MILLTTIISIVAGCQQPIPGATLTGTFEGDTIHLVAENATPNEFACYIYGPPINPVPFYGGTLCSAWGQLRHTPIGLTDSLGGFSWTGELEGTAPVVTVQLIYRTPGIGFGGDLSDGVVVTREP